MSPGRADAADPARWTRLLPAFATVLGLALPAQITFGDRGDFEVLMTFNMLLLPVGVLGELVLLIVLLFTRGAMQRMVFLSLVCFPLAGFAMFMLGALDPADRLRWALHGDFDRGRVLQKEQDFAGQPGSQLASVEWKEDGWGGMNFFSYLVHDPSDRLGAVWRASKDGKAAGLPCPANDAKRLEAGWYIVEFNLPWGDCGP